MRSEQRNGILVQEANMVTKHYSSGGITVKWQPSKCSHSARCIAELPGVFDLNRSPWIDMAGASADEIVTQIARCPSGALSIEKPQEP